MGGLDLQVDLNMSGFRSCACACVRMRYTRPCRMMELESTKLPCIDISHFTQHACLWCFKLPCLHNPHSFVCACVCVFMDVYVFCICVHECVHVCACVFVFACVFVCMYLCLRVYAQVSMCVRD